MIHPIGLTPPEELADLLIRMCREPWPTTENDRIAYFHALGLYDGELIQDPPHDPAPENRSRRFSTSLSGPVDGICSMFRDEFLGLSLFAYTDQNLDAEQVRERYNQLKRLLSGAFGDPAEEWGTPAEPACLWRPGALLLDMYCFAKPSSALMVGPHDAERSAANDAAALRRQQARPRDIRFRGPDA